MRDDNIQVCGKLFSIPAMGKYVVFLSTREQIDEASKAPIDQLSFNAAIDEVGPAARCSAFSTLLMNPSKQFIPHLIFNGFKFDPKDPRYSVPLHAMKVKLRDNIPKLLRHTGNAIEIELPTNRFKNGLLSLWRESRAWFLLNDASRLVRDPSAQGLPAHSRETE